jgi:hypothetical protein
LANRCHNYLVLFPVKLVVLARQTTVKLENVS